MIECGVEDINDVNYFLKLIGTTEITVDYFNSSLNKYIIFEKKGFVSYSIYYDRAEINYIYVLEKYRKQKIASTMMQYVINKMNNLENITLEVNINNNAAINLYTKFGFEIAARREKYYGKDDAYLMIRKMI